MKLTIHEIAQVVGAKNDWSQLADLSVNKIEFDSRLIEKGDIFLPLKGARDGHDFIEIAFDNGAIISFSEKEVEQAHLLVDDNLLAFQKLAKYYLEKTKVPVIAVTGSNGKTTTKDMIAAVLSKKFKTYKTQGNHNNEIGLPYTILHMPDDTEKLVLEMGMDHPGDIDFLSELANPELAVITLIGEAHLEHMGSRENIAKGKMGITAGLHGELIAPADPIINAFITAQLYCEENILLAVPKHFAVNEELGMYQLSYKNIKNKNYLNQKYPAVPLGRFADLPFIMLTQGNDTRTRGDRLCRNVGFKPNIVLEFNQQSTAYMASSTQLGATFISDILVSQLPTFENLVYYKLDGEEAKRKVFFYYKTHKYKTRVMEEFVRMMHEQI